MSDCPIQSEEQRQVSSGVHPARTSLAFPSISPQDFSCACFYLLVRWLPGSMLAWNSGFNLSQETMIWILGIKNPLCTKRFYIGAKHRVSIVPSCLLAHEGTSKQFLACPYILFIFLIKSNIFTAIYRYFSV